MKREGTEKLSGLFDLVGIGGIHFSFAAYCIQDSALAFQVIKLSRKDYFYYPFSSVLFNGYCITDVVYST